MSKNEIRVHRKWVFAGEHSVLRGVRALALPHPDAAMELRLQEEPANSELSVEPQAIREIVLELARSAQQRIPALRPLRGRLFCESTISQGAGLGSSAALSVGLVRIMASRSQVTLSEDELRAVATELENRFHGRSSGMDVAAVCAQSPILFQRDLRTGETKVENLPIQSLPVIRFHDTGFRSSTRECVGKVAAFCETRPAEAERLDRQMAGATQLGLDGLLAWDQGKREQGLGLLAEGMRLGMQCFERWGLVPEPVDAMARSVLADGALAVKLTGAGSGGFLVSLWR